MSSYTVMSSTNLTFKFNISQKTSGTLQSSTFHVRSAYGFTVFNYETSCSLAKPILDPSYVQCNVIDSENLNLTITYPYLLQFGITSSQPYQMMINVQNAFLTWDVGQIDYYYAEFTTSAGLVNYYDNTAPGPL